ncbi:MAG TPA: NAD-dependent epimerase/dehydratase family protein [Polyangiaceae bacterium]|nr:NAD-dependent epimerase/dehydratase family protein [Polyangiaceae bacterium]
MRVLITGGAGFIGSHIVHGLVAEGHEVMVLDNLSSGRRENVPAGAAFRQLDLRDREAVRQLVAEFRPEAVSHQAAQASVAVSVREPHLDAEVNILGGLNLLDACTAPGANVKRFVFASTGGAIYGEVPEGTQATEATGSNPQSPYAIHKLAFEQLMGVYAKHRGLETRVLRYANVYGPRQDPHGEAGVIAIFFDAALSGKGIRINARRSVGDAGCVRDYVFVSDVAQVNRLALYGQVTEPVVNLATGVPITTRELAETILKVTGRSVPLEPAPSRPGDLERSVIQPTLALRYIERLTPLEEGLRQTHAFYASSR